MKIREKSDGYVIEYPQAIVFEDLQQDVGWTAKEIDVQSDINDLLVHTSEAQSHGILSTLKLFTEYELQAGSEYWGGRFKRLYPRVEFQRLGAEFARTELCVHAPFYNTINEVLHLNTPEFYNSWKIDPVLTERMQYIEDSIKSEEFDGLLSLAVFSMIEGAVLYSSFAYLKSYKKQGLNLIPNIVSGVNFSVRDENLHSEAGAWVFNETLKESEYTLEDIKPRILKAAQDLYEHESLIVDKTFEKGEPPGQSATDLKLFVKHRIDVCLSQLNIEPMFKAEKSDIESWFYDDINGARATDHFATLSSNYSRNWKEQGFKWKPKSQ